MKHLSTNVLIIGKSGVGKSALLNYLFHKNIQKTGAGRPVTEFGLYPFNFEYDDTFTIRIHDTWGLEPDKAKEWRELIMKEVKEHDKKEICEWFNTIIYCLNANSRIVEDFEIENIKSLLNEKNNIVVVLTHCDPKKGEMTDFVMREKIIRDTNIPSENIICVNSVSQATIGGTQGAQFGREDVFVAIIQNLWKSLRGKVPYLIKDKVKNQFNEFQNNLNEYIDRKNLLFKSEKTYQKIEEDVEMDFDRLATDINAFTNRQFDDAIEYYNELSNKYAHIALLNQNNIKVKTGKFKSTSLFEEDVNRIMKKLTKRREMLGHNFSIANDDITKENLKNVIVSLKKYLSGSRKVKIELKSAIEKYVHQARRVVFNEIECIEKELINLNIDELSLLHLDAKSN